MKETNKFNYMKWLQDLQEKIRRNNYPVINGYPDALCDVESRIKELLDIKDAALKASIKNVDKWIKSQGEMIAPDKLEWANKKLKLFRTEQELFYEDHPEYKGGTKNGDRSAD